MIVTLGVWIIALSAAAGYGSLLIPKTPEPENVESETVRAYAGLLILAALLLAVSLFTNLTPWCGITAAAPGIVLCIRGRLLKPMFSFQIVIYAALALFVSTREINFYDTALYHQQAVKWLAGHGLVRGLALLYFRFGWVSSWFALAAPLSHGITEGRPAIVGGLPFALTVVSSLRILHREIARRRSPDIPSLAWVCFGGLFAIVAIVWNVDSSLSPDMIAWLLPLIVLTILSDPAIPAADRFGRATVIAALACVVKTTSAPILACCAALLVWRFIRSAPDRGKLAAYAVPATLAFALLLGSNVISSGCPAFPSPVACTSAAWSVGADATRAIQTEIQDFARTGRHNQTLPLTLAAAVASGLVFFRGRGAFSRNVLALSWAGIGFTLAVAVPRYGVGYFLLPVAAASAIAVDWLASRTNGISAVFRWGRARTVLTATLVAGVPILVAAPAFSLDGLIYPRRIAAATGDPIHIVNRVVDVRGAFTLRSEHRGALTLWVPTSSDQCWDAPLPCSPELTRDSISPRNTRSFDDGFVVRSK